MANTLSDISKHAQVSQCFYQLPGSYPLQYSWSRSTYGKGRTTEKRSAPRRERRPQLPPEPAAWQRSAGSRAGDSSDHGVVFFSARFSPPDLYSELRAERG